MKDKSQLQFIVDTLMDRGEISRNYCLHHYISRLSARIRDLKKEGWQFTTEKRGGDYYYIRVRLFD